MSASATRTTPRGSAEVIRFWLTGHGTPVYSNLYLAGEADGCDILTPDGLGDAEHLSDVQQAMVDAGVVQSAYNAPAAALLLTWLLENNPDPTKEEIKDALSGIFIRDASYEHYFLAVQLVRERRKLGHYETKTAPIFREQLREIGTPDGKVDGRDAGRQGGRSGTRQRSAGVCRGLCFT